MVPGWDLLVISFGACHWRSRSQRQRPLANAYNNYTKPQYLYEALKGDGDNGRGLCTMIRITRQIMDNVI